MSDSTSQTDIKVTLVESKINLQADKPYGRVTFDCELSPRGRALVEQTVRQFERASEPFFTRDGSRLIVEFNVPADPKVAHGTLKFAIQHLLDAFAHAVQEKPVATPRSAPRVRTSQPPRYVNTGGGRRR